MTGRYSLFMRTRISTIAALVLLPSMVLSLFFTNCSSPPDNNIGGNRTEGRSTLGDKDALTVEPKEISLASNSQQTFKVSGGTAPYEFSIDKDFGMINDNGVYSAPGISGDCQITVVDAKGKMGHATINVTAGTTFTVSPLTVTMKAGSTQDFQGVNGQPGYIYSVSGGGSITAQGRFTAPASAGISTITVTDSSGATVNAIATITGDDAGGGGGGGDNGGGGGTNLSTAPLYRFIKDTSINTVIDYYMTSTSAIPSGYKIDAAAPRFKVIITANVPDTVLLLSCTSKNTGKHFVSITTGCGTNGNLVENYGYIYTKQMTGTLPVVRLYHSTYDHYYTAMDSTEIAQKKSAGYGSEKILGYSYPP